jgi:hypothetical protein
MPSRATVLMEVGQSIPSRRSINNQSPPAAQPSHAAPSNLRKSVTCRGRGKVQPSPLVWPPHLHTPIASRTPSSPRRAAHTAAARASSAKARDEKSLRSGSGPPMELRRALSPDFSAGALAVFIPWRVGAEESGAAKLLDLRGPPGRCSGCWPHDGEVAGGAVWAFL